MVKFPDDANWTLTFRLDMFSLAQVRVRYPPLVRPFSTSCKNEDVISTVLMVDKILSEVDADFLVGPVELRADGQMVRVLHIFEGALDVGLAVERLDDGGCAPLVTAGHEDAKAEFVLQRGKLLSMVNSNCKRLLGCVTS